MKKLRRLPLSVRLAWANLRSFKRLGLSAILIIGIGMTGILSVDIFNQSFLSEIAQRTRQLASADIVISARTPVSQEVIESASRRFSDGALVSKELSIVSMVQGKSASILTEIRFVDELFPFYGTFKDDTQKAIASPLLRDIDLQRPEAIASKELAETLSLQVGDLLKVGDVTYVIKRVIGDDPTVAPGGFSFAPRLYTPHATAFLTGLISTGSRVNWIWRYKTRGLTDDQLKLIEDEFEKKRDTQQIRLRSHMSSSRELSRLQTYIGDYLGLVALTSLYLAMIGCSYLFKGLLDRSVRDLTILRAVGASRYLPMRVFSIQIFVLSVMGALVAVASANILFPIFSSSLSKLAGDLNVSFASWELFLKAFGIVFLFGLVLSVPLLMTLNRATPSALFKETFTASELGLKTLTLTFLPVPIVWWIAAIIESDSVRNGSIFTGTFIASLVVASLISVVLFRLISYGEKNLRSGGFAWRFGLRNLLRKRMSTFSALLALSIGTMLFITLPQVRSSMSQELEKPSGSVPKFFMFDIQDEQIVPLKEFLTSSQVDVINASPMIRARLDKVNGTSADSRSSSFEGERDQEQRQAMQSRMQNLSYRSKLSVSETLITGTFNDKPWDPQSGKLPEISIEKRFAERLQLKIGDTLTFDVSGVEIEGVITSLRQVRWSSFEPNFFILFQTGVLEDAPKIWVLAAKESLGASVASTKLQSDIVKTWSNVSTVDVSTTIGKILGLVDQVNHAMSFIALLCLLTSIGVVFSISALQSHERSVQFWLLKILGADKGFLKKTAFLESIILTFSAVFLGAALSIGVSKFLVSYIFNIAWKWEPKSIVASSVIVSIFMLTFTALQVRKNLRS